MIINQKVANEVYEAYFDCHCEQPDSEEANTRRNLQFRASSAVSKYEAITIMTNCVSYGYNKFEPLLLEKLPEGVDIVIAREGSPCLYVKGNLPSKFQRLLRADEFDYDKENDETRIWWD